MTFYNAPPWSKLAKLNSVKFINTMYIWLFIVPIVAKLLENVGDVAELTMFNYTFQAHLKLPFSWVAFYFSALAFAAANLVFRAKCPEIVQEQSDYAEFVSARKGVEHLTGYLFGIDMKWDELREVVADIDDYFHVEAEVSNPKQSDGTLRKRFWAIYFRAEVYRPVWRTLGYFLYVIGGLLIFYVFAQNVLFVLGYLLGL